MLEMVEMLVQSGKHYSKYNDPCCVIGSPHYGVKKIGVLIGGGGPVVEFC